MAESAIEWTDKVWNPVRGCSIVSTGCKNCYAMQQAHRFSGAGGAYEGLTQLSKNGPVWSGAARFVPEMLDAPLRWRQPKRVFVNSMSDLFHDDVTDGEIAAVFGVMAACPQHTFQILTKRPDRLLHWLQWVSEAARVRGAREPYVVGMFCVNMARDAFSCRIDGGPYLAQGLRIWPLPNVWIGVSAEHQAAADERIPLLLLAPAAVRFVSAEPLLGPIDFTLRGDRIAGWDEDWKYDVLRGGEWASPRDESVPTSPRLDWVIVGGESGPGARPCALEWIENIVGQCRDHGMPVFVKQLGATVVSTQRTTPNGNWAWYAGLAERKGGNPSEWPSHLRVREFPEVPHA